MKTLRFRSVLILILGLSLACLGKSAWSGDDQNNRGNWYNYQDGQWHEQGGAVVSYVPIGGLVKALPPEYTTLKVGSTYYYQENERYFTRSPDGGFVVVAAPQY